jgi:thymidylate kinase
MKSMLITLEGIDGAGKSTTATELARQLTAAGRRICLLDPKRPEVEDPYVAQHLRGLSAILWERGAIEPRKLLNDRHWVFLSSAWFQVVYEHVVRPALAAYDTVILDSWYPKLLGRWGLKVPAVLELARTCYATLRAPDLVCLLDLSPEAAADRKQQFGYAEAGNFDGLTGVTRENFVLYQGRVRDSLLAIAEVERWQRFAVETLAPDGVARQIVERLEREAA